MANLENAKENLQYASIDSPADGTIGTFPYRVGSLVNSSITEPLTTVSNTSNIYSYFSLNEKDFLQLVKGLAGANTQEKLKKLPGVQLILADNTPYDHPGRIDAASGLIDQKTGSVTMRAIFPNTERLLRSGGSGQIRIPQALDYPHRHIGQDKLDTLEGSDRLAKGNPLFGVIPGELERPLGQTHRQSGHRRPRGVKGHHRQLKPFSLLAEPELPGDPDIVEYHLGGLRTPQPHLVLTLAIGDALPPAVNHEKALALVLLALIHGGEDGQLIG